MSVTLSDFASSLSVETAFTVLAVAKSLQAAGKDVVELEIGDSPFQSPEQRRPVDQPDEGDGGRQQCDGGEADADRSEDAPARRRHRWLRRHRCLCRHRWFRRRRLREPAPALSAPVLHEG